MRQFGSFPRVLVRYVGIAGLLLGTTLGCGSPRKAAEPARVRVRAQPEETPPPPPLLYCEGVPMAPLSTRPVVPEALDGAETLVLESWEALRLGELVAATTAATQAVEMDPYSFRARMALGVSLSRQERRERALSAFCEARRLDESSTKALYWIGYTYIELGRYDAGVRVMQALVEGTPDWKDAWYELGFAEVRRGRFAEAVAALDRFLELAPDDPRAHYERGFALYRLERYAEAEKAYLAAIRGRPRHAAAHRELAATLLALDKPRAALKRARKAARLDREDPESSYWLGRAYLALGRCLKAASAFRDAAHVAGESRRAAYEDWVARATACEQ